MFYEKYTNLKILTPFILGLLFFTAGSISIFSESESVLLLLGEYKDSFAYGLFLSVPMFILTIIQIEKKNKRLREWDKKSTGEKLSAFHKWSDDNPEEFEKDILRIAKGIKDEKKRSQDA